jgi:hypothetical protein
LTPTGRFQTLGCTPIFSIYWLAFGEITLMTATAVPLESLAQRIAQQQSELETLRQEYEARQARLADLKRRKEELETQLHQIDAQIRAVARGETPSSAVPSSRLAAPMQKVRRVRGQRLADVLLEMVRRAKGPVTVKQMAAGVVAQKFPTNSQNIPRLIQTRVQELVAKGVLQRSKDQPGVLLAESKRDQNSHAARSKITNGARKKKAVTSKAASPVERNGQKRIPLRSMLTDLLAKSQGPLTGRELAEQVLAKGYSTTSKKFLDVIWNTLGQMDNVVNVRGKGYRLKKR